MKRASLISLFTLVGFVYSCKKDSVHLDNSTVYYKSKIEPQAFRVYSNNGEINYAYIVDRYLQLDSSWMNNIGVNLSALDSIRIIDNTKARLFEQRYNDYTYTINGKDIRFQSSDTLYGYSIGEILTRSWSYQVSVYKPIVYREYIISSTAGVYSFGYAGRRETFAYMEGDRIVVPWHVLFTHNAHTSTKVLYLQNRLASNFYNLIAPSDTVVMREFRVILEK